MIAWLDTETTGLDPAKDRILEVACIITDDAFKEVARFERVTDEARYTDFTEVHSAVLDMHAGNGLWTASLTARSTVDLRVDRASVDAQLCEFIEKFAAETDDQGRRVPPVLAGSTISFDRSFIARHMPWSHRLLHYRNLDVTTLNEVAKRFWPAVYAARPQIDTKAHRAMPDIEYSLWVARYYASRLAPAVLDRGAASARVLRVLAEHADDWVMRGSSEVPDAFIKVLVDAVLG